MTQTTRTLSDPAKAWSPLGLTVETPGMPDLRFVCLDLIDLATGDSVVDLWTRTNPASSGRRSYEQVGAGALVGY